MMNVTINVRSYYKITSNDVQFPVKRDLLPFNVSLLGFISSKSLPKILQVLLIRRF